VTQPATAAGRRAGRPTSPAFSRETVAEAVADLVCERGYAGWSMRDLSSRLGVSAGTLTHHFASREKLALAAMDYVYALPPDWEEMKARGAPERLRRICAIFIVSSPRRRRWWQFWIEYMAAAAREPELRKRQEARYERQRRFFADLIAECQPAGPDVDARIEADRLLALGNGLAIHQLGTPRWMSPAAARSILDDYITTLTANVTPLHASGEAGRGGEGAMTAGVDRPRSQE
jgi:AcrR family transcriptional regulator